MIFQRVVNYALRPALLSLLVLLPACSGGGGDKPFVGTLDQATDEIFVTEEVELTLTLDRPAGGSGLTVSVASSSPDVLTTPASIEFLEGESEKIFIATAVSAGGPVTVTAEVGSAAQYPSADVTVLAPPTIALSAVVTSGDQFSTGTLSWTGTASHPRALDSSTMTVTAPTGIGLTLGTPSLTGDETGFTLEASYELAVDAAPGTVEIFVDGNGDTVGGSATADFTIVQIPRIASFEPASAALDTTEVRPFLLTLDLPARAGGESVAVASADDTLVGVPQAVTVLEGELTASVDVQGLAVDGAGVEIEATLADSQALSSITVQDAVIAIANATGDEGYQEDTVALVVEGTGSSYVAVDTAGFSLSSPAGSGISLNNQQLAGDSSAWTLTADVSIASTAPAGTVMLPFDANGAAPGAAASIPFLVRELPRIMSVGPDGTIFEVGDPATLTVTLTANARAGGETVALVSSSANVAVPSSAMVPEGQNSAMFDVDATSDGFSTITASLNSTSDDTVVEATFTELGQVVVTEMTVMTTDSSGSNVGERIELLNASGGTLAINDWHLETLTSGPLTIRAATNPTDPTVALTFSNGELVFGAPNPTDPGDIPAGAAFVYGDPGTAAALADSGDRVRLFADAISLQDQVDFTLFVSDGSIAMGASDYPGSRTRSTQLDPTKSNAFDNDDGGNWCTSFRVADTHGFPNQSCSGSTAVINELLYDSASTDNGNTFVEIAGPGGAFLGGMNVQAVDEIGDETQLVVIPTGTRIPADGLYVIADTTSTGDSTVPNADQETPSFDPQNSAGHAVLFRDPAGIVVDALQYGEGGVSAEGSAALEAPTNSGSSLPRDPNSTDTNDNLTDFGLDLAPTPGLQNP